MSALARRAETVLEILLIPAVNLGSCLVSGKTSHLGLLGAGPLPEISSLFSGNSLSVVKSHISL